MRGRTIRIWPDNDIVGKAYAGEVANVLIGMGCAVSCVDISKLGLSESQDIIDWLGLNPDATTADVEALPLLKPNYGKETEPSAPVIIDLHEFLARELPPREQMLSPWLLTQSLNMVYAWRGVGKTHVALNIAYAIAAGGSFLHWRANRPRRVIYLDGEMPAPALQERLAGIMASSEVQPSPGMLRLLTPDLQGGATPDLAIREGQQAIASVLGDAELIIVDNLSCLVRGQGRENESEGWLAVADWGLQMRAQGRSVLLVHHSGKNGAQRGTSKREDLLDTVICLKRPADYESAQGAVFEINFEKSRNLFGAEVDPIEARLTTDAKGLQTWETKKVSDSSFDRIVALANEGLSQIEISQELSLNRSNVSRAVRKATESGKITSIASRRGKNQHNK